MSRRKIKVFVYTSVLVAAFSLLFFRSDFFIPSKLKLAQALSFPVRLLSIPLREAKKVLYYHWTFDEYLRLRGEVNALRARLTGLDEAFSENNRLERLLHLQRESGFPSIAANVVGRDPSNWNATLIIDKGRADGVALGMPVAGVGGVVGKIAEIAENQSKVILLTDPGFSVVAVTQRSREVGVISGTLSGLCRMEYLSPQAGVEIGDRIMTSRLSSSFPEGLPLGDVVAVHKDENRSTLDCLVKPSAVLSQVEEVLVIQKP